MTSPNRVRQKVAIVLPSFSGGGAERVMLKVAGGLAPDRFAVTLVVLDGTGELQADVPHGVDCAILGTPRLRHAVGRLTEKLKTIEPDVVVSTMGYLNLAILALVRPRLPGATRFIVREANIPQATTRQFPIPAIGALAYRLFYRRADRVVCNAQTVAAALRQVGVPDRLITQIDNPIDVDWLRNTVGTVERTGPGRRFIAIGRLTGQKGFDRLIDWFAQLPKDCRLTILGDGPDRAALERQRHEAGLDDRIALPGFSDQPWAELCRADAFVMPSRWEGMPNAALEAMALGTPVIATATSGGLPELSDEVPPPFLTIAEDAASFIAAMRAVEHVPGPLRPSTLPVRFTQTTVLARYADVIAGAAA